MSSTHEAPAAAIAPLDDLRVLDLTHARAGPVAVRQLADWGADVWRIERPGLGDAVSGHRRHGSDFQNLHRNKRCLSLDLKQEEGKELFLDLAEKADVIVENFRAGVKDRLGIDYPSVRSRNPRIVYGSISGFGQTGPYRDRPAVDQIIQGMAGLMSVTGQEGQGPTRVGIAISDLAAGLYLAFGILAALYERERSGEGQWVHTSLIEALIGMNDFQSARYLMEGEVPSSAGNHHPTLSPMGLFATADGRVNLAASSQGQFDALTKAIGAPELVHDRRFEDRRSRTEHRHQLVREIELRLSQRPSSFWVESLNAVGIPCGFVLAMDAVFSDPQVRHLGLSVPVEHPQLGSLRLVGQPVHLERTPASPPVAAPDKGQHTDELLAEAGLGSEAIAKLRDKGVVS